METVKAAPAADARVRTRRAIIDIIKREGPQESQELARRLGVTTMAVRQHLYELEREGTVSHVSQARPVGRPAKMWALTAKASSQFPDTHAELTVSLLGAMQVTFGSQGMGQILAVRKEQLLQSYRAQFPLDATLPQRLQALVAARSAEGYMAAVEPHDEGGWLLVENHCPICAAAAMCQGLCAIELEVFQELLGPQVKVTRTAHIQQGARRCAYRVEELG